MISDANKRLGRIAWRNVIRNWRHSLASSLAILAGFAAVSLFDGFLNRLQEINTQSYSVRGMSGDILIQKKEAQYKLIEDSFGFALDKSEQDSIEEILRSNSEFDLRVRFLEIKGMIANGRNNGIFIGFGVDVEEGRKMRGKEWEWNTVAGQPLHLVDQNSALLIGTGLGKAMDCNASVDIIHIMKRTGGYIPDNRPFSCERPTLQLSVTTEAAQVNALDLKVVGIVDGGFREQDKHWVVLPLPLAQKLLDTEKVTTISVRLKPGANVDSFVEKIRSQTRAKGLLLDIMRWQEHQVGTFMKGTMQILNSFRNLFMVIVVTICILSISNTMMKSVTERIREIGTMRSFGFLRRDISILFAMEGFFLALISCLLGVGLTILISALVNDSGITYKAGLLSAPIYLSVGLNPFVWMVNTIWLTVLASGTSWFCAKKAARMVVADAMRYV